MAYKLIEAAQSRWRAVNAPHLVALVRAGAKFENGKLVERPTNRTLTSRGRRPPEKTSRSTGIDNCSRQIHTTSILTNTHFRSLSLSTSPTAQNPGGAGAGRPGGVGRRWGGGGGGPRRRARVDGGAGELVDVPGTGGGVGGARPDRFVRGRRGRRGRFRDARNARAAGSDPLPAHPHRAPLRRPAHRDGPPTGGRITRRRRPAVKPGRNYSAAGRGYFRFEPLL